MFVETGRVRNVASQLGRTVVTSCFSGGKTIRPRKSRAVQGRLVLRSSKLYGKQLVAPSLTSRMAVGAGLLLGVETLLSTVDKAQISDQGLDTEKLNKKPLSSVGPSAVLTGGRLNLAGLPELVTVGRLTSIIGAQPCH